MDHLPKVLILSEQYPSFLKRPHGDFTIGNSGTQFGDGHHIMASFSQCSNNGEIAAFVSKKPHSPSILPRPHTPQG